MQARDIIVIGGSAGALTPLRRILRAFPLNLPASVFVVIHTAPESPGVLPQILSKAGPLPATAAVDGELIRPGHVYVARPDHHLLLDDGRVTVTRGPRENRFRPAIDPLFRTAAAAYGPRVIGILLSGSQDDGVPGLVQIKRRGGVAIAQDPDEAESPSMPQSAIRQVPVDHVLRADDMPAILAGLLRVPIEPKEGVVGPSDKPPRDPAEVGVSALQAGNLPGPPSVFTCPECGGTLWEIKDGDLIRYQCHVGHGFNGESLVSAKADGLEMALWTALRALEENAALRRRMAAHAREHGMTAIADSYTEQALEAETRAGLVRRILVTDEARESVDVPASRTDR